MAGKHTGAYDFDRDYTMAKRAYSGKAPPQKPGRRAAGNKPVSSEMTTSEPLDPRFRNLSPRQFGAHG